MGSLLTIRRLRELLMLRLCPKCGAYSADDSLVFCLADGTPLVDLEPGDEKWREGSRVISEQQSFLEKQRRKLKWRRILLTTTTMLVLVVVVSVVTLNGVFHFKPSLFPVPSPSPTISPELRCSEQDKQRVLEIIRAKFPGLNLRESSFESCTATTITVACVWEVKSPGVPQKFKCEKRGADWQC